MSDNDNKDSPPVKNGKPSDTRLGIAPPPNRPAEPDPDLNKNASATGEEVLPDAESNSSASAESSTDGTTLKAGSGTERAAAPFTQEVGAAVVDLFRRLLEGSEAGFGTQANPAGLRADAVRVSAELQKITKGLHLSFLETNKRVESIRAVGIPDLSKRFDDVQKFQSEALHAQLQGLEKLAVFLRDKFASMQDLAQKTQGLTDAVAALDKTFDRVYHRVEALETKVDQQRRIAVDSSLGFKFLAMRSHYADLIGKMAQERKIPAEISPSAAMLLSLRPLYSHLPALCPPGAAREAAKSLKDFVDDKAPRSTDWGEIERQVMEIIPPPSKEASAYINAMLDGAKQEDSCCSTKIAPLFGDLERKTLEFYEGKVLNLLNGAINEKPAPVNQETITELERRTIELAGYSATEIADEQARSTVNAKMRQILSVLGIEELPVEPGQTPYDANLHVITGTRAAEAGPMTILETVRNGYRRRDGTITKAEVIVAESPENRASEEEKASTE